MANIEDPHDPERLAYLAEGNARQARKRVAAKVLVSDGSGRVLLVDPNYKKCWDLPGGMAEANEAPRSAAEREVLEELNLRVSAGRLLALEWVAPHGPWDDQLVFVFDGGVVSGEEVAEMKISDPEIVDYGFFSSRDAEHALRADVAVRFKEASKALANGGVWYRERRGGL